MITRASQIRRSMKSPHFLEPVDQFSMFTDLKSVVVVPMFIVGCYFLTTYTTKGAFEDQGQSCTILDV